MEEKNLSKVFWTEALTGGLVIGVVLFVWDLIGYFFDMPVKASGLASFVQFLILALGIYYFSRRMREFRGPVLGYPYGTAFGFTMGMMLFVGLVYGIGEFFLQVVIAPEYYSGLREYVLLNSGLDESLIEQSLELMEESAFSRIMKNPIVFVFSGIFTMIIYGGLVGLIISAFVKRPADPFAGNTPNDYTPGM